LVDRQDLRTVSRTLDADCGIGPVLGANPCAQVLGPQVLAFTNPSLLPPNMRIAVIPQARERRAIRPPSSPPSQIETAVEPAAPVAQWGEMALTVTFTLAAVLFVSFLAVVTGLV